MSKQRFLFGFLLVLLLTLPTVSAQDSLTRKQINRLVPNVVQIVTLKDGEPYSTGSGTIFSENGLIITNRHVIQCADDLAIFSTGDMGDQPELLYFASEHTTFADYDISVLQIDRNAKGKKTDPAKLDIPAPSFNFGVAEVGDPVFIFGFPVTADGRMVLTEGVISGTENGRVGGTKMVTSYQTDAEISPGNSGGLAVDANGDMIGIPTSVNVEGTTSGRLGQIIPIQVVQELASAKADTVIAMGGDCQTTQGGVSESNNNTASTGVSASCDNVNVENGGEIIINMRPNYSYAVSAIGVNGYDPSLVVRMVKDTNSCLGSEDERPNAEVDLGGLGYIQSKRSNAQVNFSHSSSDFENISIVVGSSDGESGEVVVMIEGLAVTEADGDFGDPFFVDVNGSMINSGVPLRTYMIGKDRSLDPLLMVYDTNSKDIMTDSNDNLIACNDWGDTCWSDLSLRGDAIINADGYRYDLDDYDAALEFNISGLDPFGLPLRMSRASGGTGEYIAVLSMGFS